MHINLLIENTKFKIAIASILYKIVRLFYKSEIQTITRNKINYEIDLSEGIELSIFLFGQFQNHIQGNKFLTIRPDFIILDIGANVGIMTLQYAQKVPQGKVFAFEPTHYSFKKLSKNVSLNPDLAERITLINSFVSDISTASPEIIAYSSWKVDGKRNSGDHPIHLGTPKNADNVSSITLDDFVIEQGIKKINLIKIDADGHEFEILKGAIKTIETLKPIVLFEIAIYVMQEKNIDFDFYFTYFSTRDYILYDTKSNKEMNLQNYSKYIPNLGGTDLIAIPRN